MKEDKKELAESLLIKTDLTKTEIAQLLGISRRTMHYWTAENEWDRLKKSTDNMPAIGTENAWLIFINYQEKMLDPAKAFSPYTNDQINNLYKLGTLVRKLTKGNALNETIEMRNRFMEFANKKKPELALEIQPLMDDYIRSLARVRPHNLMKGKIDEYNCIPNKEENTREIQLDIEDKMFWYENPPTCEPDPYAEDNYNDPDAPYVPVNYPMPEISAGERRKIIREEHLAFMECLAGKEAGAKQSNDPKVQDSLKEKQLQSNAATAQAPIVEGRGEELWCEGFEDEHAARLNYYHDIVEKENSKKPEPIPHPKPLNRAQRRELQRQAAKKSIAK